VRLLRTLQSTTFLSVVLAAAQTVSGKVETIDARAHGTSTQMGKDFDVKVTINQCSSSEDRAALKAAFQKGGNDELVKALSKMKGVGRLRLPSTVGYSLAYARSIPTPTRRKFLFVTDRPIAIVEQWGMTRSEQYSLPAGEIDINDPDKDKSTGVLFSAAKRKGNDGSGLEFELFQNPWKLTHIIDGNNGTK
jgi:hypothetical protein